MRGRVKLWNAERGFGFITCEDESNDFFCHIRQVEGGYEALDRGDEVEFEVTRGRDGRMAADADILLRVGSSLPKLCRATARRSARRAGRCSEEVLRGWLFAARTWFGPLI